MFQMDPPLNSTCMSRDSLSENPSRYCSLQSISSPIHTSITMEFVSVKRVLSDVLVGIDEDALEYFDSMLTDECSRVNLATMTEVVAPFIESYGLAADTAAAEEICRQLWARLQDNGSVKQGSSSDGGRLADSDEPTVLDQAVNFTSLAKGQVSLAEQQTMDKILGLDKIRERKNDIIELNDSGNAKYIRKVFKDDQRAWLADLEAHFVGDDDDGNQISAMTMPDFSLRSNERDIHVHNFNITFGGQILLEEADLKLVFGRRYGLIGRNGIGKTTLLKHMAAFDIEGFPRHHRVLHVKQEVKSSEESVISVCTFCPSQRSSTGIN